LSDIEDRLKTLICAALAGDAPLYRRFLDEVGTHLRSYFAYRLGRESADVEDLVQETLIALHTKRSTYDSTQPVTPWLYAIARYKLTDHFRRTRRRPTVRLDDVGDLVGHADHQDAIARRDIERLLAKLPQRTQALMKGIKFDGLSTAEAAARTCMSESAVKVTVHRAMKRLSKMARRELVP